MTCTLLTIALLGLAAAPASGPPKLVEIIEIGGIPNQFDVYDFVFVDDMGVATMQSWNDADNDTIIATSVPPMPSITQKFVHNPICSILLITNVNPIQPGTQEAEVPLLVNFTTRETLAPSISVPNLGQTPALAVGTRFTVSNGQSAELPMATILAPTMSFDDIPLSLFGDPGVFPPYSGTAEVVGLLDVTVIVRCASDYNNDGNVNVTDLLELLAKWGPCPAYCPQDTNGDGNANVTDLLDLLGSWGPCP